MFDSFHLFLDFCQLKCSRFKVIKNLSCASITCLTYAVFLAAQLAVVVFPNRSYDEVLWY